jgi:hypothetical protein
VVRLSGKAGSTVVLGVLAVATIPIAVVATRFSDSYDLLHAGFAIPVALGLGWAAVVSARRVRARDDVTLGRTGGRTAATAGRLLGIVGICIACSGLIALAVYAVLTYVGST